MHLNKIKPFSPTEIYVLEGLCYFVCFVIALCVIWYFISRVIRTAGEGLQKESDERFK